MRLRKFHKLVSLDEVRDCPRPTTKLLVLGALPAGDPLVHLPVDCEGEASVNQLASAPVCHLERCELERTFFGEEKNVSFLFSIGFLSTKNNFLRQKCFYALSFFLLSINLVSNSR